MKKKKTNKIIKAWAVIHILKGKLSNICGVYNYRSEAIFSKRKDAVDFRNEFDDKKNIKIVPCEIKLTDYAEDEKTE